MHQNKTRNIWQAPWGYLESFAIVGGLLIISIVLQLTVGQFNFYLLTNQLNRYIGIIIIALSILLGATSRTTPFARWFSSIALSVALITMILPLTIIMGLTPQLAEGIASQSLLGFDSMTSCWPFVLLYTLLLLSLGALIVRRLLNFQAKDYAFYLNHIGLWLLLLASGLGYADMERYIMYVNEGESEWRVYDNDKRVKELPIAISLKDFHVEYYPQKSAIVDNESGEILHNAPDSIELGKRYRRVIMTPEPKSFASDVEVYTMNGDSVEAIIEVNKPLRVGSWMIYQYGYDNNAGAHSTYSSFELVYDRWIIPVYIGIILMMLGSVAMLWSGRKREEM